MNRTFPSWNRPRQPAVAGSTRAVDPSAQRADGYRLLVAVVVLDLGELGIDHVVALRRLAARIARGTGAARRLLRGGHGREPRLDRTSVVEGKSVSVRVNIGGRRFI